MCTDVLPMACSMLGRRRGQHHEHWQFFGNLWERSATPVALETIRATLEPLFTDPNATPFCGILQWGLNESIWHQHARAYSDKQSDRLSGAHPKAIGFPELISPTKHASPKSNVSTNSDMLWIVLTINHSPQRRPKQSHSKRLPPREPPPTS